MTKSKRESQERKNKLREKQLKSKEAITFWDENKSLVAKKTETRQMRNKENFGLGLYVI